METLSGRINDFTSFIKESSRETLAYNFSRININDFIPEKIKDYEEYLLNNIRRNAISHSIEKTNQNLKKRYSSACTVSSLKSEKRKEFEEGIELYALTLFEERKKAFHNGIPTIQLSMIECVFPPFIPTIEDFDISLEEKESVTKKLSTNSFAQANEDLAKDIKTYLFDQRSVVKKAKHFFEACKEFDSLDLAHCHYYQLKLYILISKKRQISLEKVTYEDITVSKIEFDLILKEVKEYKETEAKKIGAELIAQEALEKQNRARKTKNKKQKSFTKSRVGKEEIDKPQVENLKTQIQNLNPLNELIKKINNPDYKPQYSLHIRVKRWSVSKLAAIRTFKDFNFVTNTWEMPYINCSDSELLDFKHKHNLSGMEYFFSEALFRDVYTFPYQYKDKRTGEMKAGLGIYATLIVKNTITSGILNSGIDINNIMYHGLFNIIEDRALLPESIAKAMESFDNAEVINDNFILTTSYSFSLKEGGIIEFAVGSSIESRVSFLFYPFNLENL